MSQGERQVKIAAFDYDDTIISGQSGVLLGLYLRRLKLLAITDLLRLCWWGIRYKLKLPHNQAEAREVVFNELKDLSQDQVSTLLSQFHDKVLLKRVRKDAVKEIKKRKEEGCFVVIVSASFSMIIERAAEYLSVDGYIATNMEISESGTFTGRVDGYITEGPGKVQGIDEFANARFGKGNWELSCAYGDHHSDEEMLMAARYPHCVDADSALTKIAHKRKWPLLTWK